ncbi:MAG: 3-hydroxyacyl-ACP dehydratase FabZ [Candidatus Sericytochromatia bacterium]|nr:3-hydroxyacyl-ACP dehydratase FabZ [Candidatus Tanganyikabacteria bacterium]
MPAETAAPALDIRELLTVLPHRFPFLLIDRVLELEPGKRAVAIKNVSVNEPQFTGHFPERPLMPGVLLVEAMAQVGGLILLATQEYKGKLAVFAGIDNVRFRRMVVPGDQVVLSAELIKVRAGIGKVRASASVDGRIVADGELLFGLVD